MERKQEFHSQSPYWDWARVVFEEGVDPSSGKVTGVRLLKRKSGTLNEYIVVPGGTWHGVYLRYDGEISVLVPPAELALGNKGRWTGGGSYEGWVFAQPGAVVELNRKGSKMYIIFEPDGPREDDFPPGVEYEELL